MTSWMRLLNAMGFAALVNMAAWGAPLGPGFSYHGRLTDSGGPAKGSYDLRFSLYDAGAGGSLVDRKSVV